MRVLVRAGIDLHEVAPVRQSLTEVYADLLRRHCDEPPPRDFCDADRATRGDIA